MRQRGGAGEGALAIRRQDRLRDPPPSTGSPRRRRCSSTRRDRRPGFLRGIGAVGLTNTSISPFDRTPSNPNPSLRQRLRNLASFSRPFSRDERRAASQTSSHAAARSTPCQTSSRLNVSLSSPITTTSGSPSLQRQQIAASYLTFDNEAEPFEEGLDRAIEQRLQNRPPGSSQLEPSFGRLRLQSLKCRTVSSSSAAATPTLQQCPLAGIAALGALRLMRSWWRILGFPRANDPPWPVSRLPTVRTRPEGDLQIGAVNLRKARQSGLRPKAGVRSGSRLGLRDRLY